jgi:hypothetical protein
MSTSSTGAQTRPHPARTPQPNKREQPFLAQARPSSLSDPPHPHTCESSSGSRVALPLPWPWPLVLVLAAADRLLAAATSNHGRRTEVTVEIS